MSKKKKRKYDPTFPVRAYELSRAGLSRNQIAKALGITPTSLSNYIEREPLLKDALDRADAFMSEKENINFQDYIFDQLPKKLRKLWKKLDKLRDSNSGPEKIDALLEKKGKNARQHLFLYAFTSSNFNLAAALRAVQIARCTFENWVNTDPDFGALVRQVEVCKKEFFETQLINLVARGDTSAVIFANKTYNRDMGYGSEVTFKHEGQVEHTHNHRIVSVGDLNLPLEMRSALLDVVEETKGPLLLEGKVNE